MTTRPDPMPRIPPPLRVGATAVLALTFAVALAACRKPQPPDPERPPEPQAGTAATTSPSTATAANEVAADGDALRVEPRDAEGDNADAYRTPLERVRDVETKVGDAADATRAKIDPP